MTEKNSFQSFHHHFRVTIEELLSSDFLLPDGDMVVQLVNFAV